VKFGVSSRAAIPLVLGLDQSLVFRKNFRFECKQAFDIFEWGVLGRDRSPPVEWINLDTV
jgi:hypothetical protein